MQREGGAAINDTEDVQVEAEYFEELRAFDDAARRSYARIGIICREVKNRLLWQKRIDPETGEPCDRFTRWVKIACPWSYTTANESLRDVEELADIPDEHLQDIPPSNIPVMKQLSTAVRAEPAVLEGAKTKHTREFVEQIRESHPEQHVEPAKLMRFMPEESAAAKIEEALQMALLHGAHNRNQALELLAITAVEQWQREDELEGLMERAAEVWNGLDS